jgi:ribose transport system substrate-binding protein
LHRSLRLVRIVRMSTTGRRSWPALSLLLVLVAACGGERAGELAAKSTKLRLAVVPKGTANEFWQSVHAGAKAAAQELEVDIDWLAPQPEGNRENQINLVETCVTRKVDGLLLAPIDEQALAAPVAEARRAGVPTVVFDSALQGKEHVAFVATDNRRGGEQAGEALGALLGGKGTVIVVRYQEGSASTMARESGCLDTLRAKFPAVRVLSDNQYGPSLERARSVADALLLAHPDVHGVFTPNETTTHAMLLALDAAGKAGRVKFVGFDASPELLKGLAKAHLHALVVQDPVAMGRRGLQLLVAHLRGQSVAAVEHTALVVATPENREEPAVRALLAPDLSILRR